MEIEEFKKKAIRPLEVFNSKGVKEFDQLADELFAPDFILHDPGMPDFGTGPAAIKRFMHRVVENQPDVHIVVDDVIAEGDRIVTRFSVYATDTSTGKPVVTQAICISRFSGEKIVEEWQLGVKIPAWVPA
jgi:predicted SnoaL-like aldol condensation-catalyzing enzyme